MGGKVTKEKIYADNKTIRRSERDFQILGFYEDGIINLLYDQISANLTMTDIAQLFKIFRSIDLDDSGEIALIELFTVAKVESTRFNNRVFKGFDTDLSECINFKEFVCAMWNFCTLSKESIGECQLIHFLFSLTCDVFVE
jgi:hypothetical protein